MLIFKRFKNQIWQDNVNLTDSISCSNFKFFKTLFLIPVNCQDSSNSRLHQYHNRLGDKKFWILAFIEMYFRAEIYVNFKTICDALPVFLLSPFLMVSNNAISYKWSTYIRLQWRIDQHPHMFGAVEKWHKMPLYTGRWVVLHALLSNSFSCDVLVHHQKTMLPVQIILVDS